MADFSLPPGVIGGIGGAVGVGLLFLTVRRTTTVKGGTAVLAYGRPLKAFVVLGWAGLLGLTVLTVARPGDDPGSKVTALAALFALVLIMHLEFFRVRVAFDEFGIRTRSPWRASREIPWAAVRRVWYSANLQWHVIETDGHGRVRLHDFLGGVDSVMEELRRRGIPGAGQPDAESSGRDSRGT